MTKLNINVGKRISRVLIAQRKRLLRMAKFIEKKLEQNRKKQQRLFAKYGPAITK